MGNDDAFWGVKCAKPQRWTRRGFTSQHHIEQGCSVSDRNISAEELCALVRYDPDTGRFFSRRTGQMYKGITGGYTRVPLGGGRSAPRFMRGNRAAWLYMTGRYPDGVIDHRNGIRTDDRWENLRDVTQAENVQNIKKEPSGKKYPAPLGAQFHAKSGRWRARIRADGKTYQIGYFDTAQEASAAYFQAKARLHAGFVGQATAAQ